MLDLNHRISGHAFLNRPAAADINRSCGSICPWKFFLFNTSIISRKIHLLGFFVFMIVAGVRPAAEPLLFRQK